MSGLEKITETRAWLETTEPKTAGTTWGVQHQVLILIFVRIRDSGRILNVKNRACVSRLGTQVVYYVGKWSYLGVQNNIGTEHGTYGIVILAFHDRGCIAACNENSSTT